MSYPDGAAPALPERHGGALRVDASKCVDGCSACAEVCPTEAIAIGSAGAEQGSTVAGSAIAAEDRLPGSQTGTRAVPRIALDLGRCIFCAECVMKCPQGAITQTGDHRMAVRRREDLVLGAPGGETVRLAEALDEKLRKLFGRSLRLRQVSAGGNGAEEADLNVLSTIGWDLGRFGIQFVASPRHADGLVITGAVSKGMELALRKTWEAMPAPKLVIAVGAEAISGGVFRGNPEVMNGAEAVVPVDLFIPGWPPHPLTILDGLLRLLGRLEESGQRCRGPM